MSRCAKKFEYMIYEGPAPVKDKAVMNMYCRCELNGDNIPFTAVYTRNSREGCGVDGCSDGCPNSRTCATGFDFVTNESTKVFDVTQMESG